MVIENQIDDIERDKLDSMDIFSLLLSPELKLYMNIESIVHILCTAATTMSGSQYMRVTAISIDLSAIIGLRGMFALPSIVIFCSLQTR